MQRSALAGPASRTFGDAERQPGPVLRGVQFAPLGAGAAPWLRDVSPHQAHLGGFVPQQIVVQQAEGPPPLLNAGAAPARTQDLFLQSMPAEPSPQIQIEAEQELSRFKEHMKQIQAQLEQAVTETLQKIKAAGEAQPVHVVVNEVPVEVTKVVREEVEKLVETVKYVDRHVEVPVEKVVTKEVPVPVEVATNIIVEKPVVKEIFVDRVVTHEVPVPYDKVVVREVPTPFEVERVVERVVEKETPVYVEKVVTKEVPTPVEVIVYKEIPVDVEKVVTQNEVVYVDRIVEKPIETVKVERVEIPLIVKEYQPVVVERVYEKEVPKVITVEKQVIVKEEVPVYVDKVVTKPEIVYVDRVVEKPGPVVEVEKPGPTVFRDRIVEIEKVVFRDVPVEVEKEKVVTVIKEIPVEVIKEVVVEKEKIVYRDREPEESEFKATKGARALRSHAPPQALPDLAQSVTKTSVTEDEVRTARARIVRDLEAEARSFADAADVHAVTRQQQSYSYRGGERQVSTEQSESFAGQSLSQADTQAHYRQQQLPTNSLVSDRPPSGYQMQGAVATRAPLRRVGLGLTLHRNSQGETVVTSILPGFGAMKTGRLGLSDVILQIDGVDAESLTLDQVTAQTIGEEGTYCRLRIRTPTRQVYEVIVERTVPGAMPPTTVMAAAASLGGDATSTETWPSAEISSTSLRLEASNTSLGSSASQSLLRMSQSLATDQQ